MPVLTRFFLPPAAVMEAEDDQVTDVPVFGAIDYLAGKPGLPHDEDPRKLAVQF